MDAQSYEQRTIHVFEGNDMTTLIAIAVLAFVIYCFLAEANCSAKHSPVIVTILCRMLARHIKLGWKLFVGLIYFFGAISTVLLMQKDPRVVDAPQGHLANFTDRITKPIQMVVDGILGLLGLASIGALLGVLALTKSVLMHPITYAIAAIVTYLLWLLATICELVEEEVVSGWTYTEDTETFGPDIPHRILTKQDYIAWSAATFVIWMTIVVSTGAWILTRIPATVEQVNGLSVVLCDAQNFGQVGKMSK
jgi:hypothetical protein